MSSSQQQSIYPDLHEIHVSLQDNVAVLRLDRPTQRNAFTNVMRDSIVEAAYRLDQDDRVKIIVLTSDSPNRTFCAGADLSAGDFSSGTGTGKSYNDSKSHLGHRDGGGQVSLALLKVQKPVIAAINGHAIGIGITMCLGCDIRLVWKDAKVGFVFAQRGIVPEAASSFLLPKLLGHSRTLELFMTAKVIPAHSRSLDLLWSSLHETPEATVEAALEMARDIAKSTSATSLAMTKAMVWRGKGTPEEQHLLDSQLMHVSGNTADSKEGVRAFKEKRAPAFKATMPKGIEDIGQVYPWWSEADMRKRTGGRL